MITQQSTKEFATSLLKILPEKVDYAELVGAPSQFYGQYYVYENPEDILIEEAAARLIALAKLITTAQHDYTIIQECIHELETASDSSKDQIMKDVLNKLINLKSQTKISDVRTGMTEEDITELPF